MDALSRDESNSGSSELPTVGGELLRPTRPRRAWRAVRRASRASRSRLYRDNYDAVHDDTHGNRVYPIPPLALLECGA